MKKAFTMAEVLITIGIIGLVASMTLPSLYNHINSKGYVERLKKAHSLLQNATNLIISDYGQPEDWIPDGYKIGNEQEYCNCQTNNIIQSEMLAINIYIYFIPRSVHTYSVYKYDYQSELCRAKRTISQTELTLNNSNNVCIYRQNQITS